MGKYSCDKCKYDKCRCKCKKKCIVIPDGMQGPPGPPGPVGPQGPPGPSELCFSEIYNIPFGYILLYIISQYVNEEQTEGELSSDLFLQVNSITGGPAIVTGATVAWEIVEVGLDIEIFLAFEFSIEFNFEFYQLETAFLSFNVGFAPGGPIPVGATISALNGQETELFLTEDTVNQIAAGGLAEVLNSGFSQYATFSLNFCPINNVMNNMSTLHSHHLPIYKGTKYPHNKLKINIKAKYNKTN